MVACFVFDHGEYFLDRIIEIQLRLGQRRLLHQRAGPCNHFAGSCRLG